jgi:hypothetical protein
MNYVKIGGVHLLASSTIFTLVNKVLTTRSLLGKKYAIQNDALTKTLLKTQSQVIEEGN